MAETLQVAVVFSAGPGRETFVDVDVSPGSTVADAIDASGLRAQYVTFDFESAPTGIWGKPVPRDRALMARDRVEIYRPLSVDPKVARVRRAAKKRRTALS